MYRFSFFLLNIGMLTACAADRGSDSQSPLVETATIVSADEGDVTKYPGQMEAQTTSEVSFKVSGNIKQMLVKEGEMVRQGQTIATLDDRDFRLQWQATEARYNQVKAECERIFALHEEQAVSDNNYDKAVSGLQQIQSLLDHHKAQLDDCVLKAPYNGQVGKILKQKGELTLPGVPVVSMMSQGVPEAVITLPDKEYLQRQKMVRFTATFHAFPDQVFPLKLQSISAKTTASQQYQARFRLEQASDAITAGMTMIVNIYHRKGEADHRLRVASTALFERDGSSYVYLLDDSTQVISAVPVQVERILRNGEALVHPLTGQLVAGRQVVTSGVHTLVEGQKVSALPHPSTDNVGKII